MKKNYLKVNAFLALAAFSASSMDAQVATMYSFSQLAGTYNAITGGTVFGTTSSDDQRYVDPAIPAGGFNTSGPGIPIGFSFMFNNHTYDRVGINNNGWIGFGSSSMVPGVDIQPSYSAISDFTSADPMLQNAVAGISYDLLANGNSNLRAATLGTAPNRTFVAQWTNYQKWSGGSGDIFNFQIRLMETTNIVEVQYGNMVNGGSTTYPEVGLRGDSPSDFNNRITNNVNNWANSAPGQFNYDQCQMSSGLVPASGQIYRWSPPQCSGSLASLTATGSHSIVCPNGTEVLSLVNSYTVSGIVYSWAWSTSSAVGPYTVIPNSNGAVYTHTGVTAASWFRSTSTCLNGGAPTTTSSAFAVQIAGATIDNVPYLEDFEGIVSTNELPNCSWMSTNPVYATQTYTTTQNQNRYGRSGSKFATFYTMSQPGSSSSNYFYSNGIQLNVGVTYSASVWYTTDIYGSTNVTEFAMLYGAAQSTTGLVPIAAHSPAASPVYKPLSNTFQVPSSGVYYIAIKATTNGNYGTDYISWDDLEIIIPCSLNSPTLSASVSTQTICAGEEITLTASGADTYTWSNGATGASVNDTPANSTLYTVTGENVASGCQVTTSATLVTVNSRPNLFAYATTVTVCQGNPVTLVASGAAAYTWTPVNSNSPLVTVNPTISTSYVATGSNTLGCTDSKTIAVTVYSLPIVTVSGPTEICHGETATLTGVGAANYYFASNTNFVSGAQAIVHPNVTTTYTVTGTNALGCSNKTTTQLIVNECLGVNEITNTLSGVKLYPNPTSAAVTVELKSTALKTIQLTDISGRLIMSSTGTNEKTSLNIESLANGIYYVKVQSDNAVSVIKLVKN